MTPSPKIVPFPGADDDPELPEHAGPFPYRLRSGVPIPRLPPRGISVQDLDFEEIARLTIRVDAEDESAASKIASARAKVMLAPGLSICVESWSPLS